MDDGRELRSEWDRNSSSATAAGPGYKPVNARAFLAQSEGRRPDVVGGPMPIAAGINIVAGVTGHGKTHTMMEIAFTKACGRSRVGMTATPGKVLIVEQDQPTDDSREMLRMHAGDDRDDALDNIEILHVHGLVLDDAIAREDFRAVLKSMRPELLCIDHFGHFISTNGYSNAELRPALDFFADVRDVLKIPILSLDQLRKAPNSAANNAAPLIDSLIGGRAKSANADTAYFVMKDAASGVFTVNSAKRRSAELAPLRLTLDDEGWSRVAGEAYRPAGAEERIRTCLEAGGTLTCESIENRTGLSESAVRHALPILIYHQVVTHGPKDGRRATYRLVTSAHSANGHANAVFDLSANSAANHASPIKGEALGVA